MKSRAAEALFRRSSIAFSSEVGTGSREENASKQETGAGSDSIRTEQAPAVNHL
jgi:hypothetical protein